MLASKRLSLEGSNRPKLDPVGVTISPPSSVLAEMLPDAPPVSPRANSDCAQKHMLSRSRASLTIGGP
jgi:hypothetical protein